MSQSQAAFQWQIIWRKVAVFQKGVESKVKTLGTIQKLSHIGKILCKVIFICSIVGFCFCIAGMLSMAVGAKDLKLGSVTLKSLIQSEKLSAGTVYVSAVMGMILCAGRAVLAKFGERYCKNELAQGTPFYMEGAKELMRLGILTICIPLGTQVVTELIYEIGAQVIQGAAPLKVDAGVNVTLGIMLLFMSLLCRLGAEYREKNL